MAIKSYATKAAYTAATKSTIESQVSLIETSREVIVDGVNIITTEPVKGDVLFLDESNKRVYLKGGAWIQKAIIPTAWTHVGYVVRRFGRKVLVINKNGSDERYADVVQFKVTIPSASGTLTVGAGFVTAGTMTSISVAYEAGMTLAAAVNTYEENNDTLCGRLNTALAALTLRGTWWAYMDDNGDVIIQRDEWSAWQDYQCNGAMTHITWGDMPASSVYFKTNGKYTEFRGLMNFARGEAYWSTNGTTPSATVALGAAGNENPVTKAAFESSEYCNLLRAAYSTYNEYLRGEFGVKYPQYYGTFALPDAETLSMTYARQTAPIKAGGNKYKFPALYACYCVSYGVDGLDFGDWWLPGSEQGCYLMDDDTLAALAPSISKMGTTAINNGTNRWFAERYSVYNARFFSGNNGSLSYNNVANRLRAQAVTLLDI